MKFDILNDFLDVEIKHVNTPEHPEMFLEIIHFLTSYEIREGVFEANEHILRKLDRDTVLIYKEYETPVETFYSKDATIFLIKLLLEDIYRIAESIGLDTPMQ